MTKARTYPFLAIAIVLAWQWATVHANYGGNWSALFCTGALQPHPPLVESEHIYLFPNSIGYDGQVYHYIAHDPLMLGGLKKYVDDSRLRYRRILVPALAYVLALGRQSWIDPAYELVFLLTVGLGVYWCGRWGLLFLLIPAVAVMMDRLVVDGTLAALTAGFVYYREGPRWKFLLILACAALTRETGFLLVAAAFIWRPRLMTAASALPALAWYGYVSSRTPLSPYPFSIKPLSGVVHVLMNPWHYPERIPFHGALIGADYLAVCGGLLAIGFAFYLVLRTRCLAATARKRSEYSGFRSWIVERTNDPVTIAAMLFAGLAVMIQRADLWENAFDIGRLQSPMLVCLAAVAMRDRKPWLLAPIGMVLPRVAMQFGPQVLGVIQKAAG